MRPFAFSLVAFASLAAQAPEYFPLTPGNQWVYRAAIGEPLTVSVDRTETFNGTTYAVVKGLGAETPLRQNEAGVLLAYDAATRTERVYVDFSAPVEQTFRSAAHPCNSTAVIADRDARERLPLGDFSGLIAVRYGGAVCADAGLTQDLFLPYVGLMRRTETTLAGPRRYELVYARINGVVMVSTPETGFAVHAAVDGNRILARLTLRHTWPTPVRLEFSSGQEFDFTLKNEKGEVVYRWSDGRGFTQALMTYDVRLERNWSVQLPRPATPGRYVLEGWLTTRDGAWRASTPVDF